MSLPFADKPGQSSIYQDLKTKTLQELTADQFDAFRARMLSQGTDGLEDEYRRLMLLGLASDKLSISGAIPGTSQVITATVSTSGTPVLLFNPDPGEVWRFNGASIFGDGISGSVNHDVWLADQELTSNFGSSAVLLVDDTATAGNIPLNESQRLNDVILDENSYMYVESSGTFTSIKFLANFIRIR